MDTTNILKNINISNKRRKYILTLIQKRKRIENININKNIHILDIIDQAFKCVIALSKKYNIDDSHGITHSVKVYNFAKKIYNSEVNNNPYLINQQSIIFTSVICHDLIDSKYKIPLIEAINDIYKFMGIYISKPDIDIIIQIMSSMSYSTVKKHGFPNFGQYQLAYNIVRESDLLSAYDKDRCTVFGMMVMDMSFNESIIHSEELYNSRVLSYINDNLFITNYSKKKAEELHNKNLPI